ncbi:hypothetical protein M1563_00805 [Patescibacteria group bacterium]|nr:hypothetical protein [Patescibacteria group bacterium]MCL5410155.1 hypothetical protein [Patescibacteria group bacterium]
MSTELDPQLTQPKRHPFTIEWSIEGSLDDVLLRFFWRVPVIGEQRRSFEKTVLDRADELIDKNIIHDLDNEFKWRTRTRPKALPQTAPLAHKVEVYGDFMTSREWDSNQQLEPIHQLLDALHNFQPPIILVKVVVG